CSVVAICHKEGREQAVSAWMCIQNMSLAATAEGLGVVPSSFWGEHQEAVEKLLGLTEGYELATVMLVGVQEGYPEVKYPDIMRRPDFSWLHRNSFGSAP
ncbi:nitroreductase family protein, partial [Chloroflexota bacterium]